MKLLPPSEAAPMIACVLAAAEVSDRLARVYPPTPRPSLAPSRLRPHPDPAKRRNNPMRVYGLTGAELTDWRWMMARKNLTAIEAANVIIRSRQKVKP